MVLSKQSILKLFLARKNVLSAFKSHGYTFPKQYETITTAQFTNALTLLDNDLNVNDTNYKKLLGYLICVDERYQATLIFVPLFGSRLDKKYIMRHFRYCVNKQQQQQSNFCTIYTNDLYLFIEEVGSITKKKVTQNDGNVINIHIVALSQFYVNTTKLWHSAKFKPLYKLTGREKILDNKYTLPYISKKDDPVFKYLNLGTPKPIVAVSITQKSATNYFKKNIRKVMYQ